MAVLKVKESGVWKSPDKMHAKVAGAWVPAKKAWMKINSTWVEIYSNFPENLIVLYDTAAHVPSGATIISALNGTFPLGAATYGGTGGASAHNASAHGTANPATTGPAYQGGGNGTNDEYTNSSVSHTHSLVHTHTGTADNLPPFIDVVPTIGKEGIDANSIWLTKESSMSAVFDAYSAALNRYLRFNSNYATGGSASHSHALSSVFSGVIQGPTVGTFTAGGERASFSPINHVHNVVEHIHTLTNSQINVALGAYKANSAIEFSALPSGTLAFFNTDALPSGWSRYSYADGMLVKCSNSGRGTSSGTATHSHASQSFTTGPAPDYSRRAGGGYAGNVNHTHSMDHGHLTAVDWMPPYTGIVIGVKA
jgi:hypothetical protein